MKLNKKLLYSLTCLALSIASFLSWSFWMNVGGKLSVTNDFSWFMFQTFGWFYAILDISFFGPLIFGAILLSLAIYFAVKGAERTPINLKRRILIIIIAPVAFASILLLITDLLIIFES